MSRNENFARINKYEVPLSHAGDEVSDLAGKCILHFELIEKLVEVRLLPRSGRNEISSKFNRTNRCEL